MKRTMKSIIIPEKQSIVLPKSAEFVKEHIANVREFTFGGKQLLQVKHDLNNTIILNSLGFSIDSPILHYYEWPLVKGKYPPMSHQKLAADFMTQNRKCFNLSEPRTGKTYSILYTIDFLKQQGLIRKAIIYSTLSTLEQVWSQSIFDTFHHLSYSVVCGTSAQRKERLNDDVDIYIINHDACKHLKKEIGDKKDIDFVAWDEADNLTNGQTATWKSFNKLVRPDQRLVLATGTPTGENRPTDAWSLAHLVSPSNVPKYFGAFQRDTMIQISQFRWVPKKDAQDKVHAALQPAICFRKADVLKDLPEVTYERRVCELSEEQQRMYKEMKKDMEANYGSEQLTAVNAADRLTKLLQILLGVYKVGDDEYVPIDCQPRINTILECLRHTDEKSVIFIPFTGALRHYHKEIKKHFSCEYVDGSVSKSKRDEIFHNFQNGKHPHVIVSHPKTTAHGLELSKADKIIWAGPVHSGRTYMQACERNNSSLQKNPMSVFSIGANDLEWKIYDKLQAKKDMQNNVLDLYKSVVEGV